MIPQGFLEELDFVGFELPAGGLFDQLFDGVGLAGRIKAQHRSKMGIVGIPDLLFLDDLPPRRQPRRRDIQPLDALMPVIHNILTGLIGLLLSPRHKASTKRYSAYMGS